MYKYKRSTWGGVYRIRIGTLKPEEFVNGEWKETADAEDAFYNVSTSDFSIATEAEVLAIIGEGKNE